MIKLTKAQHCALVDLDANGACSAYSLGVSLNTMNALALKKLVSIVSEPGSMAFPRNARWRITDAGRAALAGGDDGK